MFRSGLLPFKRVPDTLSFLYSALYLMIDNGFFRSLLLLGLFLVYFKRVTLSSSRLCDVAPNALFLILFPLGVRQLIICLFPFE